MFALRREFISLGTPPSKVGIFLCFCQVIETTDCSDFGSANMFTLREFVSIVTPSPGIVRQSPHQISHARGSSIDASSISCLLLYNRPTK